MNLYAKKGPLRGHRFALEVGAPIDPRLDGPQLESGRRAAPGWQLAFG